MRTRAMSQTSPLATLAAPFLPPLRTVRTYSLAKLRRDLIAGLTVSVVEVPQAMAYAVIAGVPPVFGLYTSILQGVIGALLSSSEHMTTGPTNTQSLLIASAVKAIVMPGANDMLYVDLVFTLTIFKGLIQLSFAAARLGDLVRYVSRSVIVGLTAGAGVLIFVGQLPAFLGVDTSTATSRLPGVIGRLHRLLAHLDQANWRAILIGCVVLGIVVGVRMISKLLPGALAGVIISAAIVALVGWQGGGLPLIAPLPKGLPHFHVPWRGFGYARDLFGGALALAVLGMVESVAIAKSIAVHSGERISANQEFFAQGLKNAISSFFQCIPGSGSFTRSALDHAAGAATRFGAVFNAIFVAIIFLLLADKARFIPLTSLAAVLFVIAWGLIDWRYMRRLARTSRSDAVVCFTTFAATLLAPLEYAIFIGIFLNLALYLRRASRLQMTEMVMAGTGSFFELPLQDRSGTKQVLFLQLEGQLFFGVADELEERLARLARGGTRVFIFRLKRTHSIDSTVLGVFERFTRQVRAEGGHVILCGLHPESMRVLGAYGLLDLIGRENVFQTGGGVFTSARHALDRAAALVGHSIDVSAVEDDDDEDDPASAAPMYQI
jgi:SulP family sulfate permease